MEGGCLFVETALRDVSQVIPTINMAAHGRAKSGTEFGTEVACCELAKSRQARFLRVLKWVRKHPASHGQSTVWRSTKGYLNTRVPTAPTSRREATIGFSLGINSEVGSLHAAKSREATTGT